MVRAIVLGLFGTVSLGWGLWRHFHSDPLPEPREPDEPDVSPPAAEEPKKAPEPARQPTAPAPAPKEIMSGSSLTLSSGKTYRARLSLTGFKAMASRDQIKATFEELGFSNVRVFMTPSELPADWPQALTTDAGGTTRFGEATYNGASMTLAKPDGIVDVWEK